MQQAERKGREKGRNQPTLKQNCRWNIFLNNKESGIKSRQRM
jgi:hypothetical protein